MRLMRGFCWVWGWLVGLLWAAPSVWALPTPISKVSISQVLTIEVTSSRVAALPIAVVPFDWKSQVLAGEEVALIVQEDLARTGQFRVLPRSQMLSRPTRVDQVKYRDWRVLGVEYLLIGRVVSDAGRTTIEFDLFDVHQGERLEFPQGAVESVDVRRGAHQVSDQVYQKLTGARGIASTQLLYVNRLGEGKNKRYVLQKSDADGRQVKNLLDSSQPILSPSWSPDGQQVAYVSYESTRPAVYIQHVESGRKERIAGFPGINGAPDWSPDGRSMVLTLSKDGNPEIYQMTLASRQLRRLTRHYAIDTEPRYAPDGRSIVFTSNRGGSPQIYQLKLDDLSVERLTFEGDYNARGLISPDGKHLVMVHQRDGQFHIGVQRLGSFNIRILTKTSLDESPTIAPNGAIVLYATSEQGRGLLSGVSIDGKTRIRLPSQLGTVREPAWSPFPRN